MEADPKNKWTDDKCKDVNAMLQWSHSEETSYASSSGGAAYRCMSELWSGFWDASDDESFRAAVHAVWSTTRKAARCIDVDLVCEARRERHGFECNVLEWAGVALLITAIDDASSIEAWNRTHTHDPSKWVHLYAVITSVNGIAGDARRMQQELEGNAQLRLEVCNPPTLHDALCVVRFARAAESDADDRPFWLASEDAHAIGSRADDQAQIRADITVIITTSPVPSNPATEMLECVLRSIALVPGLAQAQKILVCDGFSVVDSCHKPRHKAGKIKREDADHYELFVEKVQKLASNARKTETTACTDAFSNLRVLPLGEHNGFGFAVKLALQEVNTEFVLVVQHDQEFVRSFDLPGVLQAMRTWPDSLKYVGVPSVTTLHYEQMARGKYGLQICRTDRFDIPLIPLIFFYDKPHICASNHYRDVVLGNGSLVQKGDFIEETLGKAQREDILQNGMTVHEKYGTYQFDARNESGEPLVIVRHINGRAFKTPEQKLALGWPAAIKFRV